MRVLDARPDSREEDIRSARRTIREEIGNPSKTVMILRGRGADVSLFADRAATRNDSIPWRELLWVRDDEIFTQAQAEWFNDDPTVVAIVLDFFDKPAASLRVDASLFQIEMAFLRAQTRGEEE